LNLLKKPALVAFLSWLIVLQVNAQMDGQSESADLRTEFLREFKDQDYNSATQTGERWIDSLKRWDAPSEAVATAHFSTGVAYTGLGQMQTAEEHFREAIDAGDGEDAAEGVVYMARIKLLQILIDNGANAEVKSTLDSLDEYRSDHPEAPGSYLVDFFWARYFWLTDDPRSALNRLEKIAPRTEEIENQDIRVYVAIESLDANVRLALREPNVKEKVIKFASEIYALDKKRQVQVIPLVLDVIRLLRAVQADEDAAKLVRWALDEITIPVRENVRWTYASLKAEEASQFYLAQRYEDSERSIGVAIAATQAGDSPTGRASMHEILGTILAKKGDLKKAGDAFDQAVSLVEAMPEPELNSLAKFSLTAAAFYYWLGQRDKGLDLAVKSEAALDRLYDGLGGNLAVSDSARSIAFLRNFSAADIIIDSGDPKKIAELVLHRKGRIFANAFPQSAPNDSKRQQSLRESQEGLFFAVQNLMAEQDGTAKSRIATQVEALKETAVDLESRTPRKAEGVRIGQQSLVAGIPKHTAVIDFLSFPQLTKASEHEAGNQKRGPELLGAIVYSSGVDPKWVVLGKGDDISRDFKQWDEAIHGYQRESVMVEALQNLYKRVWEPIAAQIPGDIDDVVLSTDFPINYVPFSCLIDDAGQFLCEKYAIHYVQNISDACRAKPVSYSPSDRVLGVFETKFSGTSAEELGLTDLKASDQEADCLSKSFDASKYCYLADDNAKEVTIRSKMAVQNIVHLSTHSVFLPDFDLNTKNQTSDYGGLIHDPTVEIATALYGSALLFDGGADTANAWLHGQRTRDLDDGLFTLAEISSLDLHKVKLVVLSSCETNLGLQLAGEGSVGFERALHAGGAKNVILTLWKIPDDDIPEFFSSYYKALRTTNSFFRAFVEAQRQTLRTLRSRSAKEAISVVGSLVFSSDSIAD
jgi:CHAT domain-containing protein/tetratricopeptide (TPR) repeat protein